MENNFERLKRHILSLSEAQDFDSALTEWRLVAVEISDEFDTCPCGQQIKEHCYIENARTKHSTYVGNVCIDRFMGIDTGNLFEGMKRIAEDKFANANSEVIKYAEERGFLYDKEYKFLTETRLKRTPSTKQREWKRKINHRILNKTIVQRRTER